MISFSQSLHFSQAFQHMQRTIMNEAYLEHDRLESFQKMPPPAKENHQDVEFGFKANWTFFEMSVKKRGVDLLDRDLKKLRCSLTKKTWQPPQMSICMPMVLREVLFHDFIACLGISIQT